MAKRKSTGKRLRFEIFKRDGFKCAYCGRSPPDVLLVVDHVIPVAAGGTDDPLNLITACEPCNQGKSDKHLGDTSPPLRDQAAAAAAAEEAAAERAAQVRAYLEYASERRVEEDEAVDLVEKRWFDAFNPKPEEWSYSFRKDERASVSHFLKRLPAPKVLEAVDIAVAATYRNPDLRVRPDESGSLHNHGRAFRYFCGVCWNLIRDREGA